MERLSYAQKQRLAFIDFKLMFVGHFTRSEVVEHFKMGLSNATRDINLYKEYAGENLYYDNTEKCYFQAPSFKPLFDYDAQKALMKLTHHLSDSLEELTNFKFPFEAPSNLSNPNISVIATLTQAALNQRAVQIDYVSLKNGESTRIIVPHTIVDNGLRWHVRAYDMKTNEFRDFVITRIVEAAFSNFIVKDEHSKMADNQWLRVVPLELVPHPTNILHPKAIELDYNMQEGVLKLEVRAAIAGYLLRKLNVDCTGDASLLSPANQLWLRNRPTLYGVNNLQLAPGYNDHPSAEENLRNNND